MKKRVMRRIHRKKAQIWVETVIYTLIGLTIIGLLLAVSKPQIDKQKDKALIEQAINGISVVDEKVYEVLSGTGNKRKLELKIGKGEFSIDSENDKIMWELDSKYQYSEEGITISAGKINVTTTPGSPYKVTLELNYPYDIRYDNQNVLKQFGQSSTPHVITVENLGIDIDERRTVINFEEV